MTIKQLINKAKELSDTLGENSEVGVSIITEQDVKNNLYGVELNYELTDWKIEQIIDLMQAYMQWDRGMVIDIAEEIGNMDE